jgi:predicted nucleic acid-binding protein
MHVRRALLSEALAHAMMEEALETMRGVEFEMQSRSVLEIAYQSELSAYDSEFVALAHRFSVPLVTSDRRIIEQFPKTALSMENFVAD